MWAESQPGRTSSHLSSLGNQNSWSVDRLGQEYPIVTTTYNSFLERLRMDPLSSWYPPGVESDSSRLLVFQMPDKEWIWMRLTQFCNHRYLWEDRKYMKVHSQLLGPRPLLVSLNAGFGPKAPQWTHGWQSPSMAYSGWCRSKGTFSKSHAQSVEILQTHFDDFDGLKARIRSWQFTLRVLAQNARMWKLRWKQNLPNMNFRRQTSTIWLGICLS